MRRVLIVCAILLTVLCFPVRSQARWTRQPAGTLAWLHDVFFLDENRGWVGGSRGTFLTTSDGGKSWQSKSKPSPDLLRNLYFADEQSGWLFCEVSVYDLHNKQDQQTYLMQTTDGGVNWKRITIGNPGDDIRLAGAVFRRGGRAWAFGEEGSIFGTRDDGLSWTPLQSATRHLLLGGAFTDDDHGWLVGAGGTVIQTSDGGYTWQLSTALDVGQNAVRFAAISFVDNYCGWVVGSGGAIYRTTNGGRTWQRQASGVAANLFDVKFVDTLEGWAVGDRGTIIHTTDGGQHWTLEVSGTESALEKIFFASRDRGWVVGFGGTILTFERPGRPRRAANG